MKNALTLTLLVSGFGCAWTTAQSLGTFTSSGDMLHARVFHTATLLADGRVLIAGGISAYAEVADALSSAELYDPVAGTFTETGRMTTPRCNHTATLLPNGKVLITGGAIRSVNSFQSFSSAEIYDPATGTFSAAGDMTMDRLWHTATLLKDGKVLLAGGFQQSAQGIHFLSSAELYDPLTGTFTATREMSSPWADTATLLADGRVLITRSDPDGIIGAQYFTDIYDPATATFSPTGSTVYSHTGPSATFLANGKVLIAGGDIGDGDGASFGAELYYPETGAFSATGGLRVAREQHSATLLADGTVLLAGGHSLDGTAEIYDPVRGTSTLTGNLLGQREGHTATLLQDGRILIAGGSRISTVGFSCCSGSILSSTEIYNPVAIPVPTVRITDNNTGSLTKLAVGDSFTVVVMGAPPRSLVTVTVSETGWSGTLGYTDESGSFRLSGTVVSSLAGTWHQTWSIGAAVAQPNPLSFTVTQ